MRFKRFIALILSAAMLCGCAANESILLNSSEQTTSSVVWDSSSALSEGSSSSSASSINEIPSSSSSTISASESSSSAEPQEVPSTSSVSEVTEPFASSSSSEISSSSSASSTSSSSSSSVSSSSSSTSSTSSMPSSSSSSKPVSSSSSVVEIPTVTALNKSILDDYKSKYFYSTLNAQQKIAYERMFRAAENFEKQPDLKDLGLDWRQQSEVGFALKYENPQFFYLSNSSSLSYEMTKEEALEMKPKLEAAAQKIVNKAMQKADVKERARVIHDEICKMTTYQLSYSEPYGPLLYGEALCEGYGKAFAYVAQMAGIDTICVTGFAETGGHLWNMIKLGNKWVHVDVTFDDQRSGVIYEYFCVDDDYAGLDHVPDSNYLKYPSALADAYDEEKIKAEFERFMAQIKENYDKGIMKTRFYSDYKPFGGLLMYTVQNMNYGVWEQGIDKQPWFMYWTNWIEIELR